MRERNIEIVSRDHSRINESLTQFRGEIRTLKRNGASLQQREDYVFEKLERMERRTLNEQAGGFDIFRGIKRKIAEMIADKFGMQQGFLRDVVVNFIASLAIADIRAMTSPDKCEALVTKLGDAIQMSLADKVIKDIGLAPENFITSSIVEALKSGFLAGGPFVKSATGIVCNMKISNFFGGFGGSKKAATPAATPAAAPTSESRSRQIRIMRD